MSTPEELKAEIERLKAENESLKKSKSGSQKFSLKVSEKGGVSVYGVGRFPVTLYKEQWKTILDKTVEIKNFLAENEASLKSKD